MPKPYDLQWNRFRSSASKDEAALFLVEFYNCLSMPVAFLEKCVPISNTAVEAVAWLGNVVFVACADGSLTMLSPFSSVKKVSLSIFSLGSV